MDAVYLRLIGQLFKLKFHLDELAEANADGIRACSRLSGNIHDLKQAFTKSDRFERLFSKN